MQHCCLISIFVDTPDSRIMLGRIVIPITSAKKFTDIMEFSRMTYSTDVFGAYICERLSNHYGCLFVFSKTFDHSISEIFQYKISGIKLQKHIAEAGLLKYVKSIKKRMK